MNAERRSVMGEQPTVLAVVLEGKGLTRYGSFRAAYDKAARNMDRTYGGAAPSRAQFHRWLTGGVRGLPHPDHCMVLEHMLTGYSAKQLFQLCPPQGPPPPAAQHAPPALANANHKVVPPTDLADLVGVFATRSDFTSKVQPQLLFSDARQIRAAGLSLNLICQQLPDRQLRALISAGTQLTCLFLDPKGSAIAAREEEEEHEPGELSTLTNINIAVLSRLRDRLPGEARDRVRIAVYDETIRFNIVLVDDRVCVAQPYLPQARGIDAPTLLVHRNDSAGGLYHVFEQVYESLEERSKQL
jgi:hypothetical protein